MSGSGVAQSQDNAKGVGGPGCQYLVNNDQDVEIKKWKICQLTGTF